MASSISSCSINECKRSCRALCLCCQQYLCLDHLNEHDKIINAQLPLLTDQINSLYNQLNNEVVIQPSNLTDLNQWRENAHHTIEQFYERKRQQFDELIQGRRNNQKKELNEMKMKFNELIEKQEGTKEEIDFMKKSIEFIEKDVNDLHHIHININPLVINDNLISIPNETTNNDNHLTTHQKRSVTSPDESSTKSMKLSRWKIEQQTSGITDSMRINVLNTMSSLIDTYGSLNMQKIIKDMKNWLNETYGKQWNVEIIDKHQKQSFQNIHTNEYLTVKETKLEWTIVIFKETS
ncbi:unnamed protein product [Adineta steineri]|uniref:Uncharacterized protein n=1 Tax=Adineta steineri TaxID=433720 RepID=A0A815WL83_9BILA|nr:unnamed protein product [Adineta steineri]CAF1658968.1 unnamed protein product [Adineta steineri]